MELFYKEVSELSEGGWAMAALPHMELEDENQVTAGSYTHTSYRTQWHRYSREDEYIQPLKPAKGYREQRAMKPELAATGNKRYAEEGHLASLSRKGSLVRAP